jgi:hypothetical protein
MKSNYLGWGLAAAIGLTVGLGASWWPIVLVSLGVGEVMFLLAMRGKRKGKMQ